MKKDIKIIGSSNIINGATTTSSGNTVAWDQTLLDDGASDDSLAGDRIFGPRNTPKTRKSDRSGGLPGFHLGPLLFRGFAPIHWPQKAQEDTKIE